MPLREGTLLACKDGIVELTAEVIDGERDRPDELIAAIRDRVAEHQLETMTDPAILDPSNLAVASCVLSRDPLGPGVHDALMSLGFEPVASEQAGPEESSLFGRFKRKGRTRLDRWRTMFLRARDVSPRLDQFESSLIDEIPPRPLAEIHEAATGAVVDAARTFLATLVAPTLDGLASLEQEILRERNQRKGRVVLHPAAVLALAAFTGDAIRAAAPSSRWDDDDEDAPLHIQAPGGPVVRSDPQVRVADFIAQGRKAALTDYAAAVLRQASNR